MLLQKKLLVTTSPSVVNFWSYSVGAIQLGVYAIFFEARCPLLNSLSIFAPSPLSVLLLRPDAPGLSNRTMRALLHLSSKLIWISIDSWSIGLQHRSVYSMCRAAGADGLVHFPRDGDAAEVPVYDGVGVGRPL